MNRLHYRLSAGMLVIVAVLGAAFYSIDRYSVRVYHEELSQRLNASLAMYVVNAEALIVDGRVNREALGELANRAMIINPTAEIYLLGRDGQILGHGLPTDSVLVDKVDLAPVRELLDGSLPMPIKGTDPRNPEHPKIFSAFPVPDSAGSGNPAGYLYVVLGGSQYEAMAAAVAGSDLQRMIAASMLLLVFAAFVAGLLLFSVLTRRLRGLTADVRAFTERDFERAPPPPPASGRQDEIDQLREACHFMAETIRRQVASLEENDRLRRELVTNISHDLRTPLTTMQGYIETLIIKDGQLEPAQRQRYLDVARKHALHLGRLVQDLFELSMLDSNGVTPAFESFSLTDLIHDVVQEFGLEAAGAGVTLKIEPPADTVTVFADISLIQRVLENLVGNALRYTPAGGTVSIALIRSSAAVAVAVTDTGTGIPATELPHIFERFYTAEDESDRRSGSMGLGLAIAKRILELHGSEIHVVSKERAGTRFRFDLPLQARAA